LAWFESGILVPVASTLTVTPPMRPLILITGISRLVDYFFFFFIIIIIIIIITTTIIIIIVSGSTGLVMTSAASDRMFRNLIKTLGMTAMNE
jgi:hypothetical protein